MLIGIISERIRKDSMPTPFFWQKKYTTENISYSENPFEAVALALPYTAEKLQSMRETRKENIFRKAIVKLKKSGVSSIVLSEEMHKYRPQIADLVSDITVADGNRIFYRFIPDAVRFAAKKCFIRLMDAKVCISVTRPDRITRYLMEKLCYDTKRLTICTDDMVEAKAMCEEFADENGFFPDISERSGNALKMADVLIDTDSFRVRVGRNVVIDDVEFAFNLNGYRVRTLDIAVCLGDLDLSDKLISYNYGKNKLTL